MIPKEIEASFLESLRAGHYNWLLGAGASLDSVNKKDVPMLGSGPLADRLCDVTESARGTALSRVARLLTKEQIKAELVDPFLCSKPGQSLRLMPRYIWRRVFSFNVDDVVEMVYESTRGGKQSVSSVTFESTFEPTPEKDTLQVIHLHGFVRAPEDGFVFSLVEYAHLIQNVNPWVALLAGILPTEPFIITGTSLNEVDLHSFLRPRADPSPKRARGPSFLVEPFPDKVTREDCKLFNLVLIEATVADFLAYVETLLPAPPSIVDLLVPNRSGLFAREIEERVKLRFFSDFQLVTPAERPRPSDPSPFLYGREPGWDDIQSHIDVEREANTDFLSSIPNGDGEGPKIVCLTDDESLGGTGKTTILKRLANDLAKSGEIVFYRNGEFRMSVPNAVVCLKACRKKPLIFYDNLADHAEEVLSLVEEMGTGIRVIGADRAYRMRHLRNVLGGENVWKTVIATPPTVDEYRGLVELYREYGLLASSQFVKTAETEVQKIVDDPIALVVCKLLNDFRPLQQIAASFWQDAPPKHRLPYLICALAHRCHFTGLRLSLLDVASGGTHSITEMFDDNVALSLDLHPDFDDFVIPTNQVIADAVISHVSADAPATLLQAFTRLGDTLAPYVNRRAIVRRSSEALIARRLFDSDHTVKPLLRQQAELFYTAVQQQWQWNSRYWEQRALIIAADEPETAVRHARHAVAIENHPYPLTTLGSLLLKQIETHPEKARLLYDEAFQRLDEAMRMEVGHSRLAIHPYSALIRGTITYLKAGGTLDPRQRERIDENLADAQHRFGRDSHLRAIAEELEALLGG